MREPDDDEDNVRVKRAVATVIACAVAAAVLLLAQPEISAEQEREDGAPQTQEAGNYGGGFQILVDPGTEAKALAYYKDVLTKDTGFKTDPRPALNDLLGYFGFSLTGEELEKEDPDAIMKNFPGGEVLIARFFAPKITDVSGRVSPANYGWRKVVRLRAGASSQAAKSGLKSLYILFNVFNGDLNISPFKTIDAGVNHSVNNQVMLIRGTGGTLTRPAYFMTFGAFNAQDPGERGKLITYLDATFDAGDPALASQGGLRRYFVPVACTVCHGGSAPKLNYLDTDHWFDRIQKGDDFEVVGKKQPVLFDAGTNDPSKPDFKKAFDRFRTLNTEIRDQNKEADGTATSFQQVAAESWLRGHATTETHLSLFQRSINATGPANWSAADPVDKKLLPLLNRYCFRCHSSVAYHVYDKSAVLDRTGKMISRIKANPNGLPEFFMPQDREIRDPDRSELIDLLGKVHD